MGGKKSGCLVIGAGSIGKRHIHNILKNQLAEKVFVYDPYEKLDMDGVLNVLSLDDVPEDVELILICSPTETHTDYIKWSVELGKNIFVEKPISHSAEKVKEVISFAKKNGIKIYVGCNMRFHIAIKFIKKNLHECGRIFYFRAYFGHYLPNWRKGIDYRKTYSAKKPGGGIILDDIHDIDIPIYLFGRVKRAYMIAEKFSSLDIETEDAAEIIMEHAEEKDGGGGNETDHHHVISSVHMDYIQKVKRRGYEVVGEDAAIVCEMIGKNPERVEIRFFKDGKVESIFSGTFDANSMYEEEMRKLFSALSGGNEADEKDLLEADTAIYEIELIESLKRDGVYIS